MTSTDDSTPDHRRNSVNSANSTDSTEALTYNHNINFNLEAHHSNTLKQFGYVSVTAGCITLIVTLASFLIYRSLWKKLIGNLISAVLLLPVGILCIMSGSNVEDHCHIITTNVLAITVSAIEIGNIMMIAIGFDMDKVILLSLLIPFSAVKAALNIAIAWLCSRYTCRSSSGDGWQTALINAPDSSSYI